MSKTILITGASSGIGKATAKHFLAEGWNVIASMREPTRETELSDGERLLKVRLDVQDPASIQSGVAAGLARFDRIDVLVNNAGYGAYGPLEATSTEKIRRQFDVNVFGLLAVTQAVLPHFRSNRHGVVVNISSIGGRITFPLGTLYHGSKFAVEGLSEALHYELSAVGVRVKVVEPGMIATDFAGRSFDFSNDPALPEYQPIVQAVFAALAHLAPLAAPPEMVARVIFTAVTDDSDRLRYAAGEDAEQILTTRRSTDDATFFAGMKAQFGLNT